MSSREHERAQAKAAQAGLLAAEGQQDKAIALYKEAAELEQKALDRLPDDRPRTRGILGVSLVALLYKAEELARAEDTARILLSQPDLPASAHNQLRAILQSIGEHQCTPSPPIHPSPNPDGNTRPSVIPARPSREANRDGKSPER
jgi:tetratricopeptide (TPR) repeat protein